MPMQSQDIEDMRAVDRAHAIAIAEIRGKLEHHDGMIGKHEAMLERIDATVDEIRVMLAKTATSEDIALLRKDVVDRFDARAAEAHASVPLRTANIFAAGMFLIALVTLVIAFVRARP